MTTYLLAALFLSSFMGVLSKKNGYILSGAGETYDCNLFNYLGDYCDKICKGKSASKGFCCVGPCFCIDLPDNANILSIKDSTKSYCEFWG
uniref:LCN-type CS-alpha/beta domain-containing protein n=1 Tax=Isometrus maculatus TaxID=497827 RepID=A0A0U1SK66_ISOMC|nr:hypothetical protein [Isometrus maculatus]